MLRRLSTKARNAAFNKCSEKHVKHFQSILEPACVLLESSELEVYNADWMRKYVGNAPVVLKPKTTEQVSEILSYCNTNALAVVPQGGNTGLVGGSVPVYDEIVLSMSLMNAIEGFDKSSGILSCQAGCVLETLDGYLEKEGYMMPLDLGAKGSCQIGGNVATNAGGLRLIRYGSLHGSVLGMEVVLANGEIVNCMSTMRKDNTGYDVKQLFIGSEGTLGVITKVAIGTPPRPKATNVAFFGCSDFEAVKQVYQKARQDLGEIVSAVEFMDRQSLDMVLAEQDWCKDPLEENCPYYVLIETSGSRTDHDNAKLEDYLENVMSDGIVLDGTVAQGEVQCRQLFALREDVSVALSSRGYVYKYDVSIPLDQYYDIVSDVRKRLAQHDVKVVGFGHLGDCNLHLSVSTLNYDAKVAALLEPYVFEWTANCNGSISAEHGIGLQKTDYLHLSKQQPAIDLMKTLKHTLDPNGILNPYKVLPQE